MPDEPRTPGSEFSIAIAGPIATLAIGLSFFGAQRLALAAGAPEAVLGTIGYLAFVNLLLLLFNLVPAFPLDGGRVLRSALWRRNGSMLRAARITSRIGSGFGVVLMIAGVFWVINGYLLGGLWWILIGFFLRNTARAAFGNLIIRRILEGRTVARFMNAFPICVPRSISLVDLAEQYVYPRPHGMYPVVSDDKVIGVVTAREIRNVPRDEWNRQTVGSVAARCSEENTIEPDADALEALKKINRGKTSRLMVVKGDRLVGLITRKDLLDFLSMRLNLEGAAC